MRVSPSAYLKYQDCARQYWYHYFKRLRTYRTKIQLLFGRAVHQAIADYHMAIAYGQSVDIVDAFERAFYREMSQVIVMETARWDANSLLATGRVLLEAFPSMWEASGLIPLLDEKGPVIEREMRARIPGSKDVMSGIIDIVAMDDYGLIYVLDYKTPASPSHAAIQLHDSSGTLPFAANSDQLTWYQILVEANAEALGIERVDKVGYMELIKRKVDGKKGPEVLPPQVVDRRTHKAVNDLMEGVRYMTDDVRRKRFPKHTGQDYNSPCKMCDFAQLCTTGNESGLVHADRMRNKDSTRYKRAYVF